MKNQDKDFSAVSIQTLGRLPYYLNFIKSLDQDKYTSVSAPVIAKALNLNEVQVRKDLAAVSSNGGKPKTGFDIEELIKDLEEFLGYNNVDEAVLVGVGHLGSALLSYKGFENYGLKIVVAFDQNEAVVGTHVGGKQVFPLEKLKDLCWRMGVNIGIITVPAEDAQEVSELLVEAGILAIWNFAPVHLHVPDYVVVQNENLAASLAVLSKNLNEKLKV
ncbi:MAG: redox-sensing transcriptional repressor Rex [Clostridia bacterium]|nr:redox-sensing transcriptional repressor Rex [Clostridia bacterium]